MKKTLDRRAFLKIAGTSLGVGVLYEFAPSFGGAQAAALRGFLKTANGEAPASFAFAQFSDTHVGFNGPPDPLGTQAFESAVALINHRPRRPEFVIFTGDLTHDADTRDAHSQRMKTFKAIAGRIDTDAIHTVPGENDAALDGGVLYREHFGETHYSFDHKGVHFIALDNVSRGHPEVGAAQLAWLKADVARFPETAPIVVFTHRPLFDLKPEWEWFTADGDQVMNVLAPYDNVTVLYGHIHRRHVQQTGKARHYAARSLIFAFNDPASSDDKKPQPFDKSDPFKDLGIRNVTSNGGGSQAADLSLDDVVLSKAEFGGVSGMQQMIKHKESMDGGSSNEAD